MSLRPMPAINLPADLPRGSIQAQDYMKHRAPAATPSDAEVYSTISELSGDFKAMCSAVSGFKARVDEHTAELNARMQTLEQIVAKHDTQGSGRFMSGAGAGIAAQALDGLREDGGFRHLAAGNMGTARITVPASISAALTQGSGTSSGGMPSRIEDGGIAAPVARPLALLDVLPRRPVTSDTVDFVQIRGDAEAGEQLIEGDEKQQIDLEGVPVRVEIATVAGWSPASKQVLSDHAGLQAVINTTLTNKVMAKLERLIIQGGTGSNASRIEGLLSQAIPFVPTVAQNQADVLGEAVASMRDAGYSPSIIVLNALDWFALQTIKTNDDAYVMGNPAAPAAPALWGCAVVLSSSLQRGDALVIDPNHVSILDREAASVMVSNSHADYFTRNLVAVLAELRAGLEVRDTGALRLIDLSASSV